MDELRIGTLITVENVILTIISIEVRYFVGEWETWIIFSREVDGKGDGKEHSQPLRHFLSSLKTYGIIETRKIA